MIVPNCGVLNKSVSVRKTLFNPVGLLAIPPNICSLSEGNESLNDVSRAEAAADLLTASMMNG